MIRYSLIIFLCILLAISYYIIYRDNQIVINIYSESQKINQTVAQEEYNASNLQEESNINDTHHKATLKPDISDKIEELNDDSAIEVHLDPTVGMDINSEQHIASSYKIIGPRQFVLLTKNDEPMVEIDLDTGNVKIYPEYDLDEVSTEFWNSIGKKYPEVCFVEEQ